MEIDYDIDGQGLAKLINLLIGENKTPTASGQIGWNPDLKTITFGDGSTTQAIATKKEVSEATLFRGGFSAKAGALPDKNSGTRNVGQELIAGSYFFITEGGTIAGIGGDAALKASAFLYLLGDNAAVASSFFGQNTDDVDLLPYLVHGDTTKDVASGTEVLIEPPSKIKTIVSYQLFQSNRLPFQPEVVSFVPSGAGIGVKVKSLSAKTGIIASFTGYLT